jgi:hypothetical protein
MLVLLGETRSRKNIKVLRERSWGRIFLYRAPTPYEGEPWAFDNGAFGAWKQQQPFPTTQFVKRLAAAQALPSRPQFGVLPDIVAGGCTSLQFSADWLTRLQHVAWPWYLAVQDGMTLDDVAPLCGRVAGLFLGGTDTFKATALAWRSLSYAYGIKFHYARASTPKKLQLAFESYADSCDSAFPLWTQARMDLFLKQYDRLKGEER